VVCLKGAILRSLCLHAVVVWPRPQQVTVAMRTTAQRSIIVNKSHTRCVQLKAAASGVRSYDVIAGYLTPAALRAAATLKTIHCSTAAVNATDAMK